MPSPYPPELPGRILEATKPYVFGITRKALQKALGYTSNGSFYSALNDLVAEGKLREIARDQFGPGRVAILKEAQKDA